MQLIVTSNVAMLLVENCIESEGLYEITAAGAGPSGGERDTLRAARERTESESSLRRFGLQPIRYPGRFSRAVLGIRTRSFDCRERYQGLRGNRLDASGAVFGNPDVCDGRDHGAR